MLQVVPEEIYKPIRQGMGWFRRWIKITCKLSVTISFEVFARRTGQGLANLDDSFHQIFVIVDWFVLCALLDQFGKGQHVSEPEFG